ncbi:MAG: flagellar protein FlaG [Alphaproteobacteria bacterium]|nr:flagellar protein FlaG [Alphaproteobacteria bacterium]
MIEAVNSVIANSSVARAPAEQQSTARSLSANPDKVQEVAEAPYVSPYISIDRSSSRAILQIRDSDTGDVLRQFPTEGQLKAYRTAQEATRREERAEALAGQTAQQPSPVSDAGSDFAPAQEVPSIETEA